MQEETYLGRAIREVAVERFGRVHVIAFSEAEVDQHGHVLAREQDVCGPAEGVRRYRLAFGSISR